MTLTFGITYSYTDFFIPLSNEFGWNHALTSTIPAVSLLVFSFGSIAGAYLTSKIGYRIQSFIGAILIGVGIILSSQINDFYELLLLFGFVFSLGSAFVVISATALSVKWFVRKRGLAVGIMASGSGFGTFLVPPIVEYLMGRTSDWRSAFLVVGSSFLVLLIAASMFMQTPEEVRLKPYGWNELSDLQREDLRDYTLKEALKTRKFWMMYSMFFLGTVGATIFLAEADPFVSIYGLNGEVAAVAIGFFGAGSLISRLVTGPLSDRLGDRVALFSSFLPELIGLAALPFIVDNLALFFAAAFGIGFGYGGFLATLIALAGNLFGSKWTQNIWAVMETGYGFGGLIGPIAAGIFFDSFNNYTGIIEISAIGVFVALILVLSFSRGQARGAKSNNLISANKRNFFRRVQELSKEPRFD
jgi:OFA family oxalate/formate antiporter-like MFS transporter